MDERTQLDAQTITRRDCLCVSVQCTHLEFPSFA